MVGDNTCQIAVPSQHTLKKSVTIFFHEIFLDAADAIELGKYYVKLMTEISFVLLLSHLVK